MDEVNSFAKQFIESMKTYKLRKTLKKIIETMENRTKRLIVAETAKNLMEMHGVTTTLDIKTKLRLVFNDTDWSQDEVSDIMDEIYNRGGITGLQYTTNGTYRTYSVPSVMDTTASKKMNKKSKKGKKRKAISSNKTNKLSRSKIVEKIRNSKGRFFTVTFIKQNGDTRIMNGQVRKDNFFNNSGNINIRESNGNQRQVDPKTIKELSISGEVFKVK